MQRLVLSALAESVSMCTEGKFPATKIELMRAIVFESLGIYK